MLLLRNGKLLQSSARHCLNIARSIPSASEVFVAGRQNVGWDALCSAGYAPNVMQQQKPTSLYRRAFTTAYQGIPSDGKKNHELLAHIIPYQSTLKADGRRVEVDFFNHSPTDIEEDEWFAGMALMNLVIREGRSWPFDEEFTSVEDWRGYFLSHTAFVVRL